jgi:spore maturation protein CgeB
MIGGDSVIKRKLGYRRFVSNRPLKVLVLHSGYHLQAEACRALNQLGHQAFELNICVGGPADIIRLLLQSMLRVQPDFVLLVNHIGFDDRGGVGDVFEWLQMPLAIWYVDSPFFIIRNLQFPAPSVSSVFLWERSLLEPLARSNVEDCCYLPLACDLSLFRHEPCLPDYAVSFVGNSMVHAGEKWTGGLSGRALELAERWRQMLLERRQCMVGRVLATEANEPNLPAWDMLASATFSATGTYRQRLLAAVAKQGLHLFGDPGWQRTMPATQRHGMVQYGKDLASVYRRSAININATSLQMPEAVNQRVFDVPAAGGFLLTDRQAALPELFEEGREVACYGSPEELASLCRHYRQHPTQREQLVARAHRRILGEHTYAHRLDTLVRHMQRRHAPKARTHPPVGARASC